MRHRFTHRFTLRTLARLKELTAMPEEAFAAKMTELGVERDMIGFLGTWLTDVASMMPEDQVPLCIACGSELDHSRKDRRYCSQRCKQRSYRKRVTKKTPPRPENSHERTKRYALYHAGRGPAVTPPSSTA